MQRSLEVGKNMGPLMNRNCDGSLEVLRVMLRSLDVTLKVMRRQGTSKRGTDLVMFVFWKDLFGR